MRWWHDMIATKLRHHYVVRERKDFLDAAALGGCDSGLMDATTLPMQLRGRDGGSVENEHVQR